MFTQLETYLEDEEETSEFHGKTFPTGFYLEVRNLVVTLIGLSYCRQVFNSV